MYRRKSLFKFLIRAISFAPSLSQVSPCLRCKLPKWKLWRTIFFHFFNFLSSSISNSLAQRSLSRPPAPIPPLAFTYSSKFQSLSSLSCPPIPMASRNTIPVFRSTTSFSPPPSLAPTIVSWPFLCLMIIPSPTSFSQLVRRSILSTILVLILLLFRFLDESLIFCLLFRQSECLIEEISNPLYFRVSLFFLQLTKDEWIIETEMELDWLWTKALKFHFDLIRFNLSIYRIFVFLDSSSFWFQALGIYDITLHWQWVLPLIWMCLK